MINVPVCVHVCACLWQECMIYLGVYEFLCAMHACTRVKYTKGHGKRSREKKPSEGLSWWGALVTADTVPNMLIFFSFFKIKYKKDPGSVALD